VVVGAGGGCVQVVAGDTILYSKFGLGSTMLSFNEEEHLLLKEEDVVGVLPVNGDIPDLKPVADRVLVEVCTQSLLVNGACSSYAGPFSPLAHLTHTERQDSPC
jgi:hypothetical protein